MSFDEINTAASGLRDTLIGEINAKLKDCILENRWRYGNFCITTFGNTYSEPHFNGHDYCVWHVYYDEYGKEYESEEPVRVIPTDILLDLLEQLQ